VKRPSAILLAAILVATALPLTRASLAEAATCNTAGTPTTTVYLPNITKTLGGSTGWVTPFIVQNVGFYSTTLEVSFYRFSDGSLVACRRISGLEPARSFADVPNNDTDLPDNSQFSVVVRSYGSEVVSVVNEQAGTGSRLEALSYSGLTAGARRVALPYVAKAVDGWLTTIVIQNLGTSTASVTASFTSFDGSSTASLTRSIGPGRSQFIDPSVEGSLESGTEYSAVLTASQPLAAVVNAHNDAASVTHPRGFSYNGSAVGDPGYTYLPLVVRNADGIGRTSRLIVQNAGTSSDTPTLTFSRFSSGSMASVSPRSAISAGRAWSFDPRMKADGVTRCPSGGGSDCVAEGEHGLTVEWGSFAVLNIVESDETAMGYVAAPSAASRVYLPNVTRRLGGTSGWTTPIVVQTPDWGPTSASLRWYRFSDGRLVTQQVLTGLVPGAGRRVDPRTVSGLSDGVQYAVVLDAEGPVTAIVEQMSGGGGDGTMIYEGFASLVEPISVPSVMTASPSTSTVSLGATAQFSVSVKDQFGATASATDWPVTWSVSPPELGTITSSGLFVPSGYGSGKVVASAGASSTAVTVTVRSPAPPASAALVPVGYSRQTVATARGTFAVHVIKEPLSQVTVKTVTGNSADCEADCPAQPLVEYLNQTGAFAGMNGTYLCPPDYSGCGTKLNSYEYSVYSTPLGAWLNEYALVSPTNALVTISGDTLRFYRHTYSYDRSTVTGAISNFPILLLGGQVVDTETEQADYQKQRGTKGSIGTDGTHVYLALVSGASVTESAYALQAMGIMDAMNLDGGGTSAMFTDGQYKVGPGRQLPNAVVLTRP